MSPGRGVDEARFQLAYCHAKTHRVILKLAARLRNMRVQTQDLIQFTPEDGVVEVADQVEDQVKDAVQSILGEVTQKKNQFDVSNTFHVHRVIMIRG